METSFIHPSRSSSVAPERQTPSPRQNSRSRRRGVDSSDSRSPSELLKEIGIAGAEVVKVLKTRGWEVCEPKGLEEHKRYYLPGGKAKGEEAKRGEDFVVGEGELYAYVLEKGGARYLILNADQRVNPNVRRSSSREKSAPRATEAVAGEIRRGKATPKRPVVFESGEDTDLIEYFSDESSGATSRHQMKKRRRKQATQEQAHSSSDQPKCGNVIVVDDNNETDSATSRGPSINNQLGSTEPPRNMRTPVEQYESALKARGSQAQLLKDLDLNLLRSVAEIAFCQVTLAASSRRNGNSLQDETHHELQRYARRIEVANNHLSASIADIAAKQSEGPTSADSGIDIPSFVSTSQGSLLLMQDIERYILLVAQAVRHFSYREPDASARSSRRMSPAAELRPLQQHIETTMDEVLELSRRICLQAKR